MKTSKPFSTISYNTPEFLERRLEELVKKRLVAFYAFVKHYAEQDEKKAHLHVIIIPNGQLQTDSVTDFLQELDPLNPLKPLGVMPWRSSKWSDWYLYACHDSAYLISKGQTRVHHYQESDFVCSDADYLHELVTTIDRTKYAKTQDFVKAVLNGATLYEMVCKGQIPAPQFKQWEAMYNMVSSNALCRGDSCTHSPLIDEETGEFIERS